MSKMWRPGAWGEGLDSRSGSERMSGAVLQSAFLPGVVGCCGTLPQGRRGAGDVPAGVRDGEWDRFGLLLAPTAYGA